MFNEDDLPTATLSPSFHHTVNINYHNMKRSIFSIVLISLTLMMNGQADFRPGYVLTKNGDTLYGKIDFRGASFQATTCRFIADGQTESRDYYPSEIAGYRFDDGKYYVSRSPEGNPAFLEFLVEGKLNVFYMRDITGERYFLEKDGMGLTELTYSEYIHMVDGVEYKNSTTKHYGVLAEYIADAPELRHRIGKISEPGHRNLTNLARDYHYAVCKDEECIIYQKAMPPFTMEIEPVAGFINYRDHFNYGAMNFLQAGMVLNLWMPMVNEKLYLRTGVLLSLYEGDVAEYTIPFQALYRYPRGVVRPELSCGLNFMSLQPYYQFALGGGFHISLTSRIALNARYEAALSPRYDVPVIPGKLAKQSVTAGIRIRVGR